MRDPTVTIFLSVQNEKLEKNAPVNIVMFASPTARIELFENN
jgi:hypothetical protein